MLARHILSILLAGYAGDAMPAVSVIKFQLLFAASSRAVADIGEEPLSEMTPVEVAASPH